MDTRYNILHLYNFSHPFITKKIVSENQNLYSKIIGNYRHSFFRYSRDNSFQIGYPEGATLNEPVKINLGNSAELRNKLNILYHTQNEMYILHTTLLILCTFAI